jgi:hypothetical protein
VRWFERANEKYGEREREKEEWVSGGVKQRKRNKDAFVY